MTTSAPVQRLLRLGASRYELLLKIASGGMATVYVGRPAGASTLAQLVAIKRAHPHLVEDPAVRRMLVAEATLAAMIHHPNVATVRDVEQLEGEILLIMDYVEGASLAQLLGVCSDKGDRLPPGIGVRIVLDACEGLAAAHRLTDDRGRPVQVVHRDVSPHNILVGTDGVARLADFGLAKVAEASPWAAASSTATGVLKGKFAYVAPEYVKGARATPLSDLFGMGIVAWEALSSQRLFRGQNEAETIQRVLSTPAPRLTSVVPDIGPELEMVVAKALEKEPSKRWRSIVDFIGALKDAARTRDLCATRAEVARYVRETVGAELEQRNDILRGFRLPAGEIACEDTISVVEARVPESHATSEGVSEDSAPTTVMVNPGALRAEAPRDQNPATEFSHETLAVREPMPDAGSGLTRKSARRRSFVAASALCIVGGSLWWLSRERHAPSDGLADSGEAETALTAPAGTSEPAPPSASEAPTATEGPTSAAPSAPPLASTRLPRNVGAGAAAAAPPRPANPYKGRLDKR